MECLATNQRYWWWYCVMSFGAGYCIANTLPVSVVTLLLCTSIMSADTTERSLCWCNSKSVTTGPGSGGSQSERHDANCRYPMQ